MTSTVFAYSCSSSFDPACLASIHLSCTPCIQKQPSINDTMHWSLPLDAVPLPQTLLWHKLLLLDDNGDQKSEHPTWLPHLRASSKWLTLRTSGWFYLFILISLHHISHLSNIWVLAIARVTLPRSTCKLQLIWCPLQWVIDVQLISLTICWSTTFVPLWWPYIKNGTKHPIPSQKKSSQKTSSVIQGHHIGLAN